MTTACDCEIGDCHWTIWENVGVCPECATVYIRTNNKRLGRTEVYSVCTYLAQCRLDGRWPSGGEC